MDDKKVARINELYHKSKSEGLTPEELKEQQILRKEYIDSFKRNLRGQLNNISIKEKDLQSVQNALESVVRRGVPSWLEIDKDNVKGLVKLLPTRDDITMPIKEQLVVEYYSR